jgi:hypothetical protein
MKRSIDGVIYNTQSAIKIATATDDEVTLIRTVRASSSWWA